MNFSGVRLDMSFKEARELEEMIERNKAKAIGVKEYDFKLSDGRTPSPTYFCPNCEAMILLSDGDFCPKCGQRLDRENIAL